ncbi:alpha/beta hydrolase [Bosea caraganae]|uniref:Alpha/beta hydrolase n=1 Tax=Bosea caraganae TaxID=2763117 RepID=A0A370L165_9HYPH|nr:alpha/beta hydrolase [Bosea caraganae]RDJ20974.1 alpha/beta hydrolase [Bosea caraganae]RDJ28473.1 alpha/beta hydrolase [Bosea caraganae]
MYVHVNGTRLYFDVEGAGLVPDGPAMRAKPTLILLHGGPGADHSIFKPAFSALSDVVQIVYLDHRGCGRSSDGERDSWNLAQWGDDVKGLCDALGIEKPIIYGASFGGFVAQAYATRHPGHAAKLILTSTAAKIDFPAIYAAFERIGGPQARAIAQAYWSSPSSESRAAYFKYCLPLYRARPADTPDAPSRMIARSDVALWFNGPANEQGRMDFRAGLARVTRPVLVLAGDRDPIMPMAFSETLVECLPDGLVRFERFPDCGHGVVPDEPERAFRLIREFILAE